MYYEIYVLRMVSPFHIGLHMYVYTLKCRPTFYIQRDLDFDVHIDMYLL